MKPKSIFLGFRNDSRTDGESGKSKLVPVPETFQYISILSTLGLVLGEEHVRHEIEIGHSSTNDTMHDICDGQQYKNHPLFSNNPQAIQICLYFDEFEVVNPLGSKRGIHKVGAFYINFKNLPPKWNSSLDNIHLLALCNCLDIKKYGFDSILAPFVADLRKLESEEGAEIVLPDNSVRVVRGTLSQVCGDNLGLNGLLGFVESFSANMPCRICVGRKDEFQTKFTGEEFDLRDRHTHSLHVEEVRNDAAFVANSGVKRDCILNSLQYFHVTSNVAVDIMHDILEGIAPMEVKLVLCKFIYDDHFFTLSDFNTFLSSHNYGFCDAKNKPSLILESTLRGTGHSLKQSASQMWCVIRVLPLLIGSLIPQDNVHWKLILKLREIVDISFSDDITDGLILYLKYLIQDHHTLFREIFPMTRLLPKHHLVVHYPMVLRELGPLIHMWSMRFEAKHHLSKRLASVVCCFKDICYTAASRHQISQCCRWQQGPEIFRIDAGEVVNCAVRDLEDFPAFVTQVPELNLEDDVSTTRKVTYCGTLYRKGSVVVLDVVDELPLFGQVSYSVIVGQNVILAGKVWKTDYFDGHIHCFIVTESNEVFFKRTDMLKNFRPLHINTHGDRSVITPRNYIC